MSEGVAAGVQSGQRRGGRRALAAAAVVILAAGACGRAPAGTPAASAPASAQTPPASPPPRLTVAVSSDFPTLDPARAQDTESVSAIQLLYQPLFTYGQGDQIVGDLASAWQWSADRRTLTVTLNPAARFADGTPVTADDVVFSLQRMLRRSTSSPRALSFSALKGWGLLRAGKPGGGIRATGPRTVVFSLKQPVSYLLDLLAMPNASIVEQGVADTPAAASKAWWFQHAPGSGPYVVADSVAGEHLDLTPNPHYWRAGQGKGPFDPIRFQIVSSPEEQLRLFDAGQLDVLSPTASAAVAASGPPPGGSRLVEADNLGTSYLGFNVSEPPFNNPLLRQAVAYALDKDALASAAGAVGGPAGGLLPPGVPGYDPALAPYPFNPSRGAALFAQAGAKPGLAVTLLTIAAGGTAQQGMTDAAAAVVKRDLAAVGFDVTVQKDSWQQYLHDLAAGHANLFQATWIADYPDAQDFFFNLLDSATAGAGNASFYSDPTFDSALQAAEANPDAASRTKQYQQLDAMVYKDLPLLPEFYTQASLLVQPWVRPDPAQAFGVWLHAPLLPQLDRVWIVPGKPGAPSGT